MKTTTGYSLAQLALHWAIAALILFNYLWSEGMGGALRAHLSGADDSSGQVHVWVGVAVLALAGLRLILRLGRGAPEAPGQPGSLAVRAAGWGHGLLYVLMIAVPLGGAIAWFGGVAALGEGHALVANLLMVVAGAHALMALFHHYILKDGLLLRMMRPE